VHRLTVGVVQKVGYVGFEGLFPLICEKCQHVSFYAQAAFVGYVVFYSTSPQREKVSQCVYGASKPLRFTPYLTP